MSILMMSFFVGLYVTCLHDLFAYPIQVNKLQLKKFYQRSYIIISSDLCNAIKKILVLDKTSCDRQFEYIMYSWELL